MPLQISNIQSDWTRDAVWWWPCSATAKNKERGTLVPVWRGKACFNNDFPSWQLQQNLNDRFHQQLSAIISNQSNYGTARTLTNCLSTWTQTKLTNPRNEHSHLTKQKYKSLRHPSAISPFSLHVLNKSLVRLLCCWSTIAMSNKDFYGGPQYPQQSYQPPQGPPTGGGGGGYYPPPQQGYQQGYGPPQGGYPPQGYGGQQPMYVQQQRPSGGGGGAGATGCLAW